MVLAGWIRAMGIFYMWPLIEGWKDQANTVGIQEVGSSTTGIILLLSKQVNTMIHHGTGL